MLLKYFYDEPLAQASYMVACPGAGEAIVIDPARDVTPYLDEAGRRGLRIIGVAETHIHADYVSGGHELAARSGATLYVSGHGEGPLGYAIAHGGVTVQMVRDGDRLMVGNVALDVWHTPGHTPEHIAYIVTDLNAADPKPMGIFTGDLLFVGDVGRPDLLETAVGVTGSKEVGARQQFANVQRLRSMPDYLQIFPGHGAGSACGKSLGDLPSTTLGYEKLFNPAFQFGDDEAAFVAWLLDGQPLTPHYFKQMKAVNQRGADLIASLPQPRRLASAGEIDPYSALVIDVRGSAEFAAGHLPGTVNIPLSSSQFNSYVGWYVDYDAPVYLIVDEALLPHALTQLRAIGVDDVPGYLTPDQARPADSTVAQVSPADAHQRQQDGALILDVRGHSERSAAHIPQSMFIHMGEIVRRAAELPREREIIVQCGSGLRSQIVVSLLKRLGFTRVLNMTGGIAGWRSAGLPLVTA